MGKHGNNQLDYSNLPILVTGGCGYIGSHMVVELVTSGFTNIVIIDNFSNSTPLVVPRIHKILQEEYNIEHYNIVVYKICLHDDLKKLEIICHKHQFFACLHFAGLKAIGESVLNPLLYYHNNINSTLNLVNCLQKHNCYNFIFSSSASVYGTSASQHSPVTEQSEVCHGIINSYGWTKAFSEQILIHNAQSNPLVNCVILRYFNPIGAHYSGLIGEDPSGTPNNLMPYLLQVAVGRRECLHIFGSDYNTIDGTGVRDYIHVMDLAYGHVLALEMDIIPKWLEKQMEYLNAESKVMKSKIKIDNSYKYDNSVSIYNLGTGKGTSVLEMLKSLEKACGHEISYKLEARRPGDVDCVYANVNLAEKMLGFKAKYNIEQCCKDSWRWQSMNPMGYEENGNGNDSSGSGDNGDSDEKKDDMMKQIVTKIDENEYVCDCSDDDEDDDSGSDGSDSGDSESGDSESESESENERNDKNEIINKNMNSGKNNLNGDSNNGFWKVTNIVGILLALICAYVAYQVFVIE